MSEPATSAYDRLSPQRRRFVDAYIGEANWNAAQAARLAGYSEAAAANSAYKLLQREDVQAAVQERLEEFAMSSREVLARLTEQGRALYAEFIDEDGSVDLYGLRRAGLMRLVKKISWDRNENRVVEFHDPQRALELLGKHHRLFTDKTEHSGPDGGPVLLREVIVELPPDDAEEPDPEAAAEPLAD